MYLHVGARKWLLSYICLCVWQTNSTYAANCFWAAGKMRVFVCVLLYGSGLFIICRNAKLSYYPACYILFHFAERVGRIAASACTTLNWTRKSVKRRLMLQIFDKRRRFNPQQPRACPFMSARLHLFSRNVSWSNSTRLPLSLLHTRAFIHTQEWHSLKGTLLPILTLITL